MGEGSQINIWTDPWLPRAITRRPMTPRGTSLLTRVEELIGPLTGTWDEQLVNDTFWQEDAELILSIPISDGTYDWPAWHYDSKGRFSVRSAYNLAVQKREREVGCGTAVTCSSSSNTGFKWQKIWHLKIPNKAKMFLWRLAHNSLPVRKNLKRRG